jgi:hypothetical protein
MPGAWSRPLVSPLSWSIVFRIHLHGMILRHRRNLKNSFFTLFIQCKVTIWISLRRREMKNCNISKILLYQGCRYMMLWYLRKLVMMLQIGFCHLSSSLNYHLLKGLNVYTDKGLTCFTCIHEVPNLNPNWWFEWGPAVVRSVPSIQISWYHLKIGHKPSFPYHPAQSSRSIYTLNLVAA